MTEESGVLKKIIPTSWQDELQEACAADWFNDLEKFVVQEWQEHKVFPPKDEIFAALAMTPLDKVKVVILGQDPYHNDNQAHGLSFSVKNGEKFPPSLRNIYKELQADLNFPNIPEYSCLSSWAKQGVLLLNTILTVRAHQAGSHQKQGWEKLTDHIIKLVNQKASHVVFILWGGHAQSKAKLLDAGRHTIIKSVHPSPLSAHRGFFGSKPFSKTNQALNAAKQAPIAWESIYVQ